MLAWLKVRNLALVEEATVEWGEGLNVITGETGAGKSVLMGALALLLGERADAGAVRAGADKCVAEARFELKGAARKAVEDLLDEAGIDAGEDGELVVRRVVRAGGGGSASVNDSPATAGLLKRLGGLLVDLHGPHDHQSLFRTSAQLDVLDAVADDQAEREAYGAAWAEKLEWEERLEALEGDVGDVEGQIDLLEYRVREIREAELDPEEEPRIREEHEVLGNLQRVLELSQEMVQAISEGEPSALGVLHGALAAGPELSRLLPEAAEWAESLGRHADALAALSSEIQRRAEGLEADGARLEWLDARIATYERLKRKYGPEVADVERTGREAAERLADLKSRDERRTEAKRQLARLEEVLQVRGKALRKRRQAAAEKLGPAVTKELRELGFETGRLDVELQLLDAPGAQGLDHVEMMFAPNAGEGRRPLRAIASSGEISRVMLAIKVVLAAADRTDVLVFDEIDANVGGETAHAVGRKLRAAARARQVIAITHLAPVAAQGEHHVVVSKSVEGGRTMTRVRLLATPEEREAEITRMLGGEVDGPDATGAARRLAAELLRRAHGDSFGKKERKGQAT